MKVEILRCWKSSKGTICGEYYIHRSDGGRELVFQNGDDIKLLVHWQGKTVGECITAPTQQVKEAIVMASVEYLKRIPEGSKL